MTGANGNRYHITFPKGQLPPVNGYWPATMYQLPGCALVANSIDRYALGLPGSQGHIPCLNPDDSLSFHSEVKP